MTAQSTEDMPRWQWRTFAPNLEYLRRRLPNLADLTPTHSRETFIVSTLVPHGARIRSEHLDARKLIRTGRDGLQCWDSAVTALFPIPADDVARLFRFWGLPRPPLKQEHYSLTLFLEDLVRQRIELHLADVEITRYDFTYESCPAEMADVVLNGVPMETLRFHHTDEAAVLNACACLGLDGARNVSYTQVIKDLVGLTALPVSS